MKWIWILFLCVGCSSVKVATSIPNLSLVGPGVLRGGQPDTQGWDYLKSVGVSNVVKLNEASEATDGYAQGLGMRVCYHPISLWRQVVGPVDKTVLEDAVKDIQPGTFVHCEHGQDRTGLVIACYRVTHDGWTRARAQSEMLSLGFHKSLLGLWGCWLNLSR